MYKWKKIDEIDDININSKKKKNMILSGLDGDENIIIQEDLKGEEKLEDNEGIFKTGLNLFFIDFFLFIFIIFLLFFYLNIKNI